MQRYDRALKIYQDLKEMNYSGKGTNYLAVNKLTGEEDLLLQQQKETEW
jgi:hypothetical protein